MKLNSHLEPSVVSRTTRFILGFFVPAFSAGKKDNIFLSFGTRMPA
jgi:hypothetical protein